MQLAGFKTMERLGELDDVQASREEVSAAAADDKPINRAGNETGASRTGSDPSTSLIPYVPFTEMNE